MKLLFILALLALTLTGCAAHTNQTHGIPNFAIADDSGSPSNHCCGWVYRGGQPNSNGWAYLKSIGVKYVVKLNDETEGSDSEAERLGMKVEKIVLPPRDASQLFDEPCLQDILDATRATESGSMTSVFVHCTHGQDRTGLVIAAYKIFYQAKRWNKTNAYAEMLRYGFHPSMFGLKKCWDNLPYIPYSTAEPYLPK